MQTQQEFLDAIEAHLRKTGMTATAFGKAAARDPGFVFELRRGRSPSLATAERVMAFVNGVQQEQPTEAA